MRRGHHGIGGWRNDNQRHFRPRGGGTPHFRPPRAYRVMDAPRFPPGPRPLLATPHFSLPPEDHVSQSQDRGNYHPSQHKNQRHDRGHRGKRILPFIQRMMHSEDGNRPYDQQNIHNFYDDQNNQQSMYNSMGDVDHRQLSDVDDRKMAHPSPWVHPPPQFYENTPKHRLYDNTEQNKLPTSDYSGHRPPASDHYGGNTSTATDNSNAFSRSINDTVDIVRKRLMDREANPQPVVSLTPQIEEQHQLTNLNQEPPVKKKTQRQRQIVKSNCDKIKDKIVHQLFKMDKDKIHRLMDNPSSSSKFEYAISSLVTESQNSFNRHLRSVAEKSLNSSSEFHHDNNTIYEDTFMKQMQCILEPQDTVLLEDIKPMVLAELNKVMQLNDYEQTGDDQSFYMREEQHNESSNFEQNDQHSYGYDRYSDFDSYSTPQDNYYSGYERPDNQHINEMPTPLFERRKSKNRGFNDSDGNDSHKRGASIERRRNRNSIEAEIQINDAKITGDQYKRSATPLPNFSSNVDRAMYDDDPFETTTIDERRKERRSIEAEKRIQDAKITNERFKRSCTPLPTFESVEKISFEDNLFTGTDIEEIRKERRSIEAEKRVHDAKITNDKFKRSATPLPLFSSTADTLTYEDDPFAELDRQYHVAVDRNFIESDDFGSQIIAKPNERSKTPVPKSTYLIPEPKSSQRDTKRQESQKSEKSIVESEKINQTALCNENPSKIKKEIDSQLHSIAKSPLKFTSPLKELKTEPKTNEEVKQELLLSDSDTSLCSVKVTKPLVKTEPKKQDNSEVKKHEKTDSQNTDTKEKSEISGTVTITSTSDNSSRKRSNEQKTSSHRKEKRKKSESNQSETNKQILNKNIIINVNDCAGKSSDKCDTPKSIFNLFFSKEKSNQDTASERKKADISDKIVPRKETPKKKDHENDIKKKPEANSQTHPTVNPADSKAETTTKLKSIDMFGDMPRKTSTVHQAHRNTSVAPAPTPKTSIEVKKPLVITGRKLIRKHVATQVLRKIAHKEIQTDTCKSMCTRFIQTERKKLITRAAQTDPVAFKSDTNKKSCDSFERMKEIDMEIQVLLQEKFRLYSSIEMKESCSSTMESLGMAVLNMPVEEQKEVAEQEFTDEPADGNVAAEAVEEGTVAESALSEDNNEDSIVEDFTNIPVEELEEIAFETVASNRAQRERKNARQRILSMERNKSESPTGKSRSKRKVKTPNISLIEQIITDDRPLEDIISLDDLEEPINKSKKKGQKSQSKPKKTKGKKGKANAKSVVDFHSFGIKSCSVVITREDLNKYLKKKSHASLVLEKSENVAAVQASVIEKSESQDSRPPERTNIRNEDTVFNSEETVENDIQFDMLDVSEDIVIGDVCEIKCNDKDTSNESVNEEIILDNSQSSMEEAAQGEKPSGECWMYDFSADENLQRDTVAVTGNGDAVLALECVEKDFIAACLDGNVYHFGEDGQLLNTLRGSNLAVTCLTVVKEKCGTTVYTGSLDSRIRYYDLETGLEKGPECNVLSPIQTMDRAWDTVFVGTRTGFVLQFECKNNMLIPVSTVKFSEQSILALRALKEGPRKVLLVAARSEAVTIKDAQTGLLLRTLEGPKMTVYTLLFEDGKVYCGTSSHQIHVFDYASGTHVGSHEGGKGAVCLRACGGLVFAGCYDGCVYVYREGEGRPLAQLKGPSLMLLSIAVVGTKIIAGYKDRSLYIWKIPLGVLQEMIL